jgi:hypothetical protein
MQNEQKVSSEGSRASLATRLEEFRREVVDKLYVARHSAQGTKLQAAIAIKQCEDFLVEQVESLLVEQDRQQEALRKLVDRWDEVAADGRKHGSRYASEAIEACAEQLRSSLLASSRVPEDEKQVCTCRHDSGASSSCAIHEKQAPICMFCDGCGWCEGSPAFSCPRCKGTGIEKQEPQS